MGDFEKDINSRFSDARIKAMLNILYTANWISNKQVEFFRPYSISPQQFNILRILRGAKEPLKVQTIKDRMVERSPNATRLMDKLCAKALIERISCETDRRVVHIKITNKGLSLLKQIDSEMNNDIINNLSDQEAKTLSRLLDKIR